MLSLIRASSLLNDPRSISRERNKMHARKTRQRKKEIMHNLEKRVLELKADQINLKQQVNEKNTANILLKMFSTQTQDEIDATDPQLDEIMKRSTEDIPDASKIPELPTLILPGHHTSKKIPSHLDEADTIFNDGSLYPDDGIDYELLGKDRSTCTSEELDKIRKERNRMHAKRTRDRKRIFVDAMEKIIRQLENENTVLQKHLQKISNTHSSVKTTSSPGKQTPFLVSPSINPTCPPVEMTYAINEDLFQQSEEDSSLQECEQISASSLYSDVDDHSGARPPNLSKSSLRENISIITSNTQDYDTARNPSDTGMIHPNKKLCLGIDSTFSRHSSNEIPACTDI
jgi:regulator of replication initiation timing